MEILKRIKGILLKPEEEWGKIAQEDTEVKDIIIKYLAPLAVIPAVASFLGYVISSVLTQVIGAVYLGTTKYMSFRFLYGLKNSIYEFIVPIAVVCIVAVILTALAENFKSNKDIKKSFQLVAYSFTPLLIAGILLIIPIIGPIGKIAGLYGLYIFYLGVKPMLKTPEDQHIAVTVVGIVSILVISGIIHTLFSLFFFWL